MAHMLQNNSSVIINGKTIYGNDISINNDKIIVDGKEVDYTHNDQKNIDVIVHGNVNILKCNHAIINGDVYGDVKANTVKTEAIGGDVKANTVKAEYIKGDVKANTVKTYEK